MSKILETIKELKPNVEIEVTESPLLNQKPYEVSNRKFCELGFVFEDKLKDSLKKSLNLFDSIRNY